jgi:hypothetical protein
VCESETDAEKLRIIAHTGAIEREIEIERRFAFPMLRQGDMSLCVLYILH